MEEHAVNIEEIEPPGLTAGFHHRKLSFCERFFPETTCAEWNDWRWQLRHRIRDIDTLSRFLRLSDDERKMDAHGMKGFPMAITPYYTSLLDQENPLQPIRRTVVPTIAENVCSPGEAPDPLGEEHNSPVPGIVHRYPDRDLFLVTNFCFTYCRYCTRSRTHYGEWVQLPLAPLYRDRESETQGGILVNGNRGCLYFLSP